LCDPRGVLTRAGLCGSLWTAADSRPGRSPAASAGPCPRPSPPSEAERHVYFWTPNRVRIAVYFLAAYLALC